LHVHVAMSDQLKRPLRIDRTANVELIEVVGGTASLAVVFDLLLAGPRSETVRAERFGFFGRRDLVDRHRALDS